MTHSRQITFTIQFRNPRIVNHQAVLEVVQLDDTNGSTLRKTLAQWPTDQGDAGMQRSVTAALAVLIFDTTRPETEPC